MKLLLLLSLLELSLARAQTTSNTLDSQFGNPTNLTDKQMSAAKDFLHEGQRENFVKQKCAKSGNACEEPLTGMQVEDMIKTAYTLMNAGLKLEKKTKVEAAPFGASKEHREAIKARNAENAKKKEETTDYCGIAATAWEGVSLMLQNSLQAKIVTSTADVTDIQLRSMIGLKENHKAREKTATVQASAYGAVTACYVAMLASGSIKPDWKYFMKVGGAGALATLYVRKAVKHAKAAGKVQEVINNLDKVGKNCNPWTGTACFCAEKTSPTRYPTEYQEVCVVNKGDARGERFQTACVTQNSDKKLALDEKCDCKKTNSCARSPLIGFSGRVGLGTNLMAQANKTFDLLGQGEFDRAQLQKGALAMGSMATTLKIPEGTMPKLTLTQDQTKIAEELASVMDPAVAQAAAAAKALSPSGESFATNGRAAIGTSAGPHVKGPSGASVEVEYKQTEGMSNAITADPANDFSIPNMAKPEESDETEVVSFADQAISKADVSNASTTPIFDIISNRYRLSGWKSLDTEGR